MSLLNLFKFTGHAKTFFAWQIELTTRCQLKCRMCIREETEDWFSSDMRIEDFKKLTPYLRDVETVVLQGWGEPLLYKHLIDAVKAVKTEGSQVGFITSGKGLNRGIISELIDSGIDFICFSLAGTTALTHNSIRVTSDLYSLLNDIKTFTEIKAEKMLKKPRLSIVYLMLRDNISEVVDLPQLAKDIGVEEITLINLIHVTNEWQEVQKIFTCNKEMGYGEVLKEAEIKARELGIKLRRPYLSPVGVAVCEEDPLRNLYISVDGEVSPCVFLYPPTSFSFKRIYCGKEYKVDKLSFGNIFRESLDIIWNSKEYVEFRERFMRRKKKVDDMRLSLYDMERLRRFEITPLPDPPAQCRTCHKMLGL